MYWTWYVRVVELGNIRDVHEEPHAMMKKEEAPLERITHPC